VRARDEVARYKYRNTNGDIKNENSFIDGSYTNDCSIIAAMIKHVEKIKFTFLFIKSVVVLSIVYKTKIPVAI
jgi:hypothetical protein